MMNEMLEKLGQYLQILQLAIVDMSSRIADDKVTMSVQDIEDAHYVIGMATVSSANCEALLKEDSTFFVENLGKIQVFMFEMSAFTLKLSRELAIEKGV